MYSSAIDGSLELLPSTCLILSATAGEIQSDARCKGVLLANSLVVIVEPSECWSEICSEWNVTTLVEYLTVHDAKRVRVENVLIGQSV